jgi:hypothetical protein
MVIGVEMCPEFLEGKYRQAAESIAFHEFPFDRKSHHIVIRICIKILISDFRKCGIPN